jgi:hypothetical protein
LQAEKAGIFFKTCGGQVDQICWEKKRAQNMEHGKTKQKKPKKRWMPILIPLLWSYSPLLSPGHPWTPQMG